MHGNRLILSALVISLAQIAFLGWIIAGRAAVLRDGQEVLLKVEPVDPRDLLRGDYVRLGYEIANLETDLVRETQVQDGQSVYVRVKQGADGFWHPELVSLGSADPSPRAAGEVDLRGTITNGWRTGSGGSIRVDYGIERFYLPEGAGRQIEKDMRVRPFSVKVAVGRDGTPQIKALLDDGRVIFEEPLY